MPTTVERELEAAEREAALRKSNNDLLRRLGDAKAKKDELVAAVKEAVTVAISALEFKPIPKPTPDNRRGTPEVAIAVLSDWQLAKKTPTYGSEVCERRIELYGDKVVQLANIERAHHPVREVHVYLVGDIVEGEMIFAGQAHRIDASLYRQVVVDGPRILGNFIRKMLANFDKVVVVGVIGNHGSIGGPFRKDYHPETNADAMVYDVTRQIIEMTPGLDKKRLAWEPCFTPGETTWYATDRIGLWTFFLAHGHQMRGGFAGIPWYGFYKRILGWKTSKAIPDFDYAITAHYHTPVRMYLNGTTLWGNGSTESDNTYALEELSASGEPAQWFLMCHPTRGVTTERLVQLGENA